MREKERGRADNTEFNASQEEALKSILSGHSTMVILPTGTDSREGGGGREEEKAKREGK